MRSTILFLCAVIGGPALAETCVAPKAETREINHANLFIEDNAGDGDIGVHGYFDDEGWRELCVYDPSGELIYHVEPAGRLARLGVSGVFSESREPGYETWDYAALKADWPEGLYTLRAVDFDGGLLTGAAWFTTVLPETPQIVTPASVPEPDRGGLPVVPMADLEVEWKPVTASRDGRPITIRGYQMTVEKYNYEDKHGFSRPAFDVHLGPTATSIVVPAAFFDRASVYEIEVLAIEESGNQTIGGASFFQTE